MPSGRLGASSPILDSPRQLAAAVFLEFSVTHSRGCQDPSTPPWRLMMGGVRILREQKS